METINLRKGLLALSPLVVFLALYLLLSLVENDFYAVPITVAFLLSSVYSILILRGRKLDERIRIFSKGAAQGDLLMMIWIFILAGAFASTAKAIGSIQATVDFCLILLPPKLLLASMFLASCLISLSVGTSVGTIASLVPITTGIAQETGAPLPVMVAAVVGGAFFGDNLSFISDTTIVATKTQGCRMSDKFRTNIRIALPAALVVLVLYIVTGMHTTAPDVTRHIDWLLVLPYVLVLVTALCGINVMAVLTLGILSTCLIGLLGADYNFFHWLGAMGDGIMGMSELIIVTLMAAGMVGVIRHLGGIDFLLQRLTSSISGSRGAELTIAALAVFTDLCTANNTIAILTVGPLAREITVKYRLSPRRSASLLDTFSCFAQGIIPYGAQLLIASGLASINPIEIIPHLYYPMLLGLCALVSILRKH
ncbi:MAG: Na+/H+ antiporter NhaC family protein [Prevotellaceae bacterium]|nr:Na+/H+ antiporter NhaC family protein [Prevotellaceae bacterium]